MKRPLALLVATVAVAGVLSGCGSDGPSSTLRDAATMSYTFEGKRQTLHVSRARLLSEVRSLVNNKPFAEFLAQQDPPFIVSPDLSADSRLAAIWLTQLIQQEAIDQLFETRDLRVTAAGKAAAAENAAEFFPGEGIFPAFSAKFRATLIDRQARSEAVVASYTDTSDKAGQAYFRSHQSTFGCASGKDVAHILVPTEAAAQAIVDQLAAGGTFATLAEQSTDQGSAQQGGSLGCLKAEAFVPAFQTAADAAPLGTVVGPVKTEFGYHVILVTKAAPTTYAAVRPQVLEALQQEGGQKFGAAVNGLLKRFGKVHIDPRFGTWEVTPNAQGQSSYRVAEPKAPTPATSREGTTTTTVPAAPTGSP